MLGNTGPKDTHKREPLCVEQRGTATAEFRQFSVACNVLAVLAVGVEAGSTVSKEETRALPFRDEGDKRQQKPS